MIFHKYQNQHYNHYNKLKNMKIYHDLLLNIHNLPATNKIILLNKLIWILILYQNI